MPYTRYTSEQKQFVRQHYHTLSNAEIAQAIGADSARKVQNLARKMCVKWRAENGAPRWREPKQPPQYSYRQAA